jgi:hypothetical protein
MKNNTRLLIKAFRTYARPPFAKSAKDDKTLKTVIGPFTGAKPERDARAKELREERARVGSLKVRRAYRHYHAGRTARGNNCLGLATVVTAYSW